MSSATLNYSTPVGMEYKYGARPKQDVKLFQWICWYSQNFGYANIKL